MRSFYESTVRVRYSETDQMGVAYHGSVLPWFEVGRTDWLRQTGLSYREIEQKWQIHLAVVEVSFRYEARIHYDDLLTVKTCVGSLGKVRVTFNYEIYCQQQRVVSGKTLHSCVDARGIPIRWPESLKKLLLQSNSN